MKPPTRAFRISAPCHTHYTQCRRLYSTSTTDPSWFPRLREQMLTRKYAPRITEFSSSLYETATATLADVLPPTAIEDTIRLISHNQLLFNAHVPASELLPDGCDALHAPGEPFTRRMWAGGSAEFQKDFSFRNVQQRNNRRWACYERIRDVQLRGGGGRDSGDEKLIVNIERRFRGTKHVASVLGYEVRKQDDALVRSKERLLPSKETLRTALEDEDYASEVWEDSPVVEERNIIFMRDRSAGDVEAFKKGVFSDVRYVRAPGAPEFSHTLTPTNGLLFRWSAITWNAHKIHLDREYARLVEGHRDLLVHGPLTMVLMLGLITSHLKTVPKMPQEIQSIEYRNLAPLYANEELKICGGLRSQQGQHTAVYDIWIQGPTGGMAVKATVRTLSKLSKIPQPSRDNIERPAIPPPRDPGPQSPSNLGSIPRSFRRRLPGSYPGRRYYGTCVDADSIFPAVEALTANGKKELMGKWSDMSANQRLDISIAVGMTDDEICRGLGLPTQSDFLDTLSDSLKKEWDAVEQKLVQVRDAVERCMREEKVEPHILSHREKKKKKGEAIEQKSVQVPDAAESQPPRNQNSEVDEVKDSDKASIGYRQRKEQEAHKSSLSARNNSKSKLNARSKGRKTEPRNPFAEEEEPLDLSNIGHTLPIRYFRTTLHHGRWKDVEAGSQPTKFEARGVRKIEAVTIRKVGIPSARVRRQEKHRKSADRQLKRWKAERGYDGVVRDPWGRVVR